MAAIRIIADRKADEFNAKKIIKAIRESPDEEPEVAVKREFGMPGQLIGIQVKIRSHVNKALAVFATQNMIPKHEATPDFVEDGLVRVGLLIRDENGRTRTNTQMSPSSEDSIRRQKEYMQQRRRSFLDKYAYRRMNRKPDVSESEDTDTETGD